MKFAKGSEENYSTEVFKIVKALRRKPRPVYELEYLRKQAIDSKF